ncbi:MAG: Rieske (2Fe-2S) protein [Longimicrobiales bacterium]
MPRRDFVALGASALAFGGCAGAAYVVPRSAPGRLSISVGDVGADGVLMQTADMARPIYVRRLTSGELVAVLASCTHQGCQPEPASDRLICPCHGSEFSFDGAVLQGPAERALVRYAVTEESGDVVVWLQGRGAP